MEERQPHYILENEYLRVEIGLDETGELPGYFVRRITLPASTVSQVLLEGRPGREFVTRAGSIAATECDVRRLSDGTWTAILSGKADGWIAREILVLPPDRPYLKREQTYRFIRNMTTTICPGFVLPVAGDLRYTFAMRPPARMPTDIPSIRVPAGGVTSFPFHAWYSDGAVAVYGLDKRFSPGTLDFAPGSPKSGATLSVYYPDKAGTDEMFLPVGTAVTLTEIIAARPLAEGEDPLVVARRLADSLFVREGGPVRKRSAILYPVTLRRRLQNNVARHAWARAVRDDIVHAAEPWRQMSDQQLWDLMFGNTLPRSAMVWSNGFCPSCRNSVPMFSWKVDALAHPWKMECPSCAALFPTNDFKAYYDSGLDERRVFQPDRADRSLLFNAAHSDAGDLMHTFGVDDGTGYSDGTHRWRFIGAYLIYGQWKQLVIDGIKALAAAHVATGEAVYAHKTGILLDRVADLYPTFDFMEEAEVYEKPRSGNGYVTVWHDAVGETLDMVTAYDQVFDALLEDRDLISFLSDRARRIGLANPKRSFGEIQRNIEERILLDPLANLHKIRANYPSTEIAVITILTVLDTPEYRRDAAAQTDSMLKLATAVDGVTGEKGLAGYTAGNLWGVATFLQRFEDARPGFLADIATRHPRIHAMFRFHIDMWFRRRFYPLVGDTGHYGARYERYMGAPFAISAPFYKPGPTMFGYQTITKNPGLAPSMFTFFMNLYRITGDVALIQVMRHNNYRSTEGLPHDMFAEDPEGFQRETSAIIAAHGEEPVIASVNKTQWRLAMLRSGSGARERATWISYEVDEGVHGHRDGMNIGLFAHDLDLLPDLGYPPLQFGGWDTPQVRWYKLNSASHDTVVVDGKPHAIAAGVTTLWGIGRWVRVVRVSGPEIIGGRQFERTLVLVDTPSGGFYLVDLFRVVGGTDHAKFLRSHHGVATASGLTLAPAADYGHDTIMRNFRTDRTAQPGWSVDWELRDGQGVHLLYTDLTTGAEASLAESWVTFGGYDSTDAGWIPTVMTRRRGSEPLASTFIAILQAHRGSAEVSSCRRVPLVTRDGRACSDADVAIEVCLAGGVRDVLVLTDAEDPLGLSPVARGGVRVVPDAGLETDAELAMVRHVPAGHMQWAAMGKGKLLAVNGRTTGIESPAEFQEMDL